MAYISTERVKSIRDQIKNAYPRYKWSVSRRHGSTVVIVLQESDLPYDNAHQQINQYWLKQSEKLTTKTKLIFQRVLEICNSVEACYNRNAEDVGADYADSTYFIDLDIGQWDQPHKVIDAVGPRHPRARVGKIVTPAEAETALEECRKTQETYQIGEYAPGVAGIPSQAKPSEKPAGYIPYLNLSIVEEAI
jgi:hypothetical protein